MSKQETPLEDLNTIKANIDQQLQSIRIITHSDNFIKEEIEKYCTAKKNGEDIASSSFNDYLKQAYYADQPGAIVVADLRNQNFQYANFQNADFSGSLMNGVQFYDCDVSGASFSDTDLRNVWFDGTILKDTDFRGADLTSCGFSATYQRWIDTQDPKSERLEGIKFSTTQKMEREYLREIQIIDENIAKEREEFAAQKKRDIDKLEKAMKAERGWGGYYGAAYSEKYNQLAAELGQVQNQAFNKKANYPIDPSLLNVMGFNRDLDPLYVRGSSQSEREIKRQYIHLSKEDIETYLDKIKTEPSLSLNDFTKRQAIEGKLNPNYYKNPIIIDPNSKVVADCEGLKLTGLDFSNAKISEVNFAGSDLEGCKFDKADISRSSFEGANVKSTSFVGTNATNANFFSSNLAEAQISNSDFSRTFMSRSKSENIEITGANFNYVNIKDGKWNGAQIENSQFNNSNLEGISLVRASIKSVEAQHTILNNAVLENSKIIASNFKDSLMTGVSAASAEFEKTILENVKAPFANFEKVKFDELTTLEGADLENAILNYVQAEKVNFTNANLDGVQARFSNLKGSTLEGANARFADFREAVLDRANANKVDMTGCNFQAANLEHVIFTDAVLKDINATECNLKAAVCENADLKGANFKSAILEEVNARKAKLQNVKTDEKTKAERMDVQGAEVDALTDELQGAKGRVIEVSSTGEKVEKDIEQHNAEVVAAAKEKNAFWLGKQASKLLGGFGSTANKIGEFVKQPFSTKTGKILGAIAGVALGAAIVSSVVLTAGLSIPVMIGVGAACVGICAAAGAIAGHFTAKKIGIVGMAGGVAGLSLGVPGVVAGVALGVAVDAGVGAVSGKTASEHLGNGIIAVADLAKAGKEKLEGGGELGEKVLREQKILEEAYVVSQKEVSKKKKSSIDFTIENELANKRGIEGGVLPTKEPKKQVTKEESKKTSKRTNFVEMIKNKRSLSKQSGSYKSQP